MENPVIILGAGNLGKVAYDIFSSNEVLIYCFLDEDKELHGTEINGISVMGDLFDDGYLKMIGKKCNAFIALDDVRLHKSAVKTLKERRKVMPVNAVHPAARISEMATIGHGNLIGQGAAIGTNTDVADHCILRPNVVLEDHVKVGNFVQIGAGSIVSSSVTIEDEVFIGSGVTIVAGVKIEKGARIGAGSVVIKDVKKGETVFGNPAAPVS